MVNPCGTILKFLTIVTCFIKVNATLGKVMQDAVLMVGDSGTFVCSSNISAEMHWHRDDVFLFARGKIDKSFRERFTMDIDNVTGTYTLTLLGAKPEDAGLYRCRENLGIGEFSTAYLTVLESNPICETNIKTDGFVGQNTCHLQTETIQLSCAVSFSGKQPLSLIWSSSNGRAQLNESLCDIQPNRTVCSLTLRPELYLDGSAFRCHTAASNGARYNCSTEDVKVHYLIKEHDLKPVEKKINDEVTCSVKTNQNLRYNWTQLQDNDHVLQSSNKTYVIRNSGLYWCSATYIIKGGVTCHTLVSVVHVQSEEALTGHQNLTTFAAVMAITLVALIAMSIAVLIDKIKKRNPANKELESVALETSCDQEVKQKFQPSKESSTKNWKFVKKLQLKDSKKPIYGIAILNDELFSISRKDSKFEVYSIEENFPHKRSCSVEGLMTPKDIISCRYKNCLFIKDYIKGDTKTGDKEVSANIFRVNTEGRVEKKWKIDGDTGQISISGTCNVLVPLWDGSKLLEFTYNGERVHEIEISPKAEITHLRQAILIDCRHFVLIHGDDESEKKHRVCALGFRGDLLKEFVDGPGNSTSHVNLPSHLVVDECNSIIVADRKNNRLLLLSSQLDSITAVDLDTSEEVSKLFPWRLCLNIENSMLIVSDNVFDESTGGLKESRIFVYSTTVESQSNQKS